MKEKWKDFQQMTENSTADFHSSLKEIIASVTTLSDNSENENEALAFN